MADPAARPQDLEVVERPLAPAQEGVALTVSLELELEVRLKRGSQPFHPVDAVDTPASKLNSMRRRRSRRSAPPRPQRAVLCRILSGSARLTWARRRAASPAPPPPAPPRRSSRSCEGRATTPTPGRCSPWRSPRRGRAGRRAEKPELPGISPTRPGGLEPPTVGLEGQRADVRFLAPELACRQCSRSPPRPPPRREAGPRPRPHQSQIGHGPARRALKHSILCACWHRLTNGEPYVERFNQCREGDAFHRVEVHEGGPRSGIVVGIEHHLGAAERRTDAADLCVTGSGRGLRRLTSVRRRETFPD